MSDLDRFRERLRQNRTAQRQTIADAGAETSEKSTPAPGAQREPTTTSTPPPRVEKPEGTR